MILNKRYINNGSCVIDVKFDRLGDYSCTTLQIIGETNNLYDPYVNCYNCYESPDIKFNIVKTYFEKLNIGGSNFDDIFNKLKFKSCHFERCEIHGYGNEEYDGCNFVVSEVKNFGAYQFHDNLFYNSYIHFNYSCGLDNFRNNIFKYCWIYNIDQLNRNTYHSFLSSSFYLNNLVIKKNTFIIKDNLLLLKEILNYNAFSSFILVDEYDIETQYSFNGVESLLHSMIDKNENYEIDLYTLFKTCYNILNI